MASGSASAPSCRAFCAPLPRASWALGPRLHDAMLIHLSALRQKRRIRRRSASTHRDLSGRWPPCGQERPRGVACRGSSPGSACSKPKSSRSWRNGSIQVEALATRLAVAVAAGLLAERPRRRRLANDGTKQAAAGRTDDGACGVAAERLADESTTADQCARGRAAASRIDDEIGGRRLLGRFSDRQLWAESRASAPRGFLC